METLLVDSRYLVCHSYTRASIVSNLCTNRAASVENHLIIGGNNLFHELDLFVIMEAFEIVCEIEDTRQSSTGLRGITRGVNDINSVVDAILDQHGLGGSP